MLTYFLVTIALIPILNSLSAACLKSSSIVGFVNKISAILFAVILLGIYQKLEAESFYLVVLKIFSDASLGFLLDFNALTFLILLNFIWLVFAFYSSKLFELMKFEEAKNFQLFFNLNIAAITLLIISKNLIGTLVFYNFIIVISLVFAMKFLYKKQDRFSNFFIFLFYLKSLLIFLAVILTYKFIGKLEFISGNINSSSVSLKSELLLISTYLITFFLFLITPFYQLYWRNINQDMAIIYNFFLLPFAFAGLFVFTRILTFIFGFKNFSDIVENIGFVTIEIIFLLALILPTIFLILSKNLKSSFFYLFFQRCVFALFALLFFAKFDITRIYLPIYGFMLEFTLIFLSFSSLNAYFSNSEDKNFVGTFYKMPITCGVLAFAFLSMIGFAPTTGMLEKFLMLKIIIHEKLLISLIFIIFSSASLLLFFIKSFRFIFLRSNKKAETSEVTKNTAGEMAREIAREIDLDSNLILSTLIVAIALFSLFIINFFHHL